MLCAHKICIKDVFWTLVFNSIYAIFLNHVQKNKGIYWKTRFGKPNPHPTNACFGQFKFLVYVVLQRCRYHPAVHINDVFLDSVTKSKWMYLHRKFGIGWVDFVKLNFIPQICAFSLKNESSDFTVVWDAGSFFLYPVEHFSTYSRNDEVSVLFLPSVFILIVLSGVSYLQKVPAVKEEEELEMFSYDMFEYEISKRRFKSSPNHSFRVRGWEDWCVDTPRSTRLLPHYSFNRKAAEISDVKQVTCFVLPWKTFCCDECQLFHWWIFLGHVRQVSSV